MVRHTTAVVVLWLVAALMLVAPHHALACGCCACHFASGEVGCIRDDPDGSVLI
jgi:hypothetical protein